MKRSKIYLFLLFLGGLCSLAGCAEYVDTTKKNILLIVVDTLRQDHLGTYGYERDTSPNIDQFAEESVVFERAYSHSPWTMPSVASIFTSLTPRDHGIANWRQPLDEEQLTLAEHLGKHGYHNEAYISHIIFKPEYGFNQGFKYYDDSVLKLGKEQNPRYFSTSKEISDNFIRRLDSLTEKPFFVWLHYFDPHNDYLFHEDFYFGRKKIDRYDSEISYTDFHIGRVLKKMKEMGLLERTIVVFIADHGEEFGDHGKRYHSWSLFEELIRVPLIIRVPGFKSDRIKNVVAESDLAPTLLNLLGLPVPEEFKGVPIKRGRNCFKPDGDRTVFAETYRYADKQGVVSKGWKLVHDREKDRLELYDLRNDPKEKAPVNNAAMLKKMKTLLDGHFKAGRKQAPEQEMSDELKTQLESLGYLQ